MLGREIIRLLLAEGVYRVHSLDLSIPPEQRRIPGVASYIRTDITSRADLVRAMKGMEVVFHTASLVPTCIRNTPEAMHRVNLGGTTNVVGACEECEVKRLIYTSSSAVFMSLGRTGYENMDEFVPYPKVPLNSYVYTKAKAEQLVRKAYNDNGLRTCALRLTGLIASKRDPVMRALINFLVGHGDYYMSWTTLQAAGHVHVLADKHLRTKSLSPSANVFNVVSHNVKYRDMNKFFCLGYNGKPSATIPMWVCQVLAKVNEFFFWLTGWPPIGEDLCDMVLEFICPYTLSTEHTEQVLGWAEKRPWKEVMGETMHRKY